MVKHFWNKIFSYKRSKSNRTSDVIQSVTNPNATFDHGKNYQSLSYSYSPLIKREPPALNNPEIIIEKPQQPLIHNHYESFMNPMFNS